MAMASPDQLVLGVIVIVDEIDHRNLQRLSSLPG